MIAAAKHPAGYSCRTAIARFRRILLLLKRGPTTSERLAAELEISVKTVDRDLAFLRDQLELPIERGKFGTRLTRATDFRDVFKKLQ